MIDKEELRKAANCALAVEQVDIEWYTVNYLDGPLCIDSPDADYIVAANPQTILALLDENDALQAKIEMLHRDAAFGAYVKSHVRIVHRKHVDNTVIFGIETRHPNVVNAEPSDMESCVHAAIAMEAIEK